MSLTENKSIELSQQLLKTVKLNFSTDLVVSLLASLSNEQLKNDLKSDEHILSFWLNIYNATTQIALTKDPDRFKNRNKFYKMKLITIAGECLSLDQIEHGVLRKGKHKYSLGYFKKIFQSKFIRSHRPSFIDSRIHFSLNCGAKSCPPILFYKPEMIEAQLNLSTQAYLEQECELKEGNLFVPVLFKWFQGDFGGRKGIYHFLEKHEIIRVNERPKIEFKKYNWDLSLANYQES